MFAPSRQEAGNVDALATSGAAQDAASQVIFAGVRMPSLQFRKLAQSLAMIQIIGESMVAARAAEDAKPIDVHKSKETLKQKMLQLTRTATI